MTGYQHYGMVRGRLAVQRGIIMHEIRADGSYIGNMPNDHTLAN